MPTTDTIVERCRYVQPYGVSFSEALEESVNDLHRLFWNTPWPNVEAKVLPYTNKDFKKHSKLSTVVGGGIGSAE
jgi:hypothetical protein